MTITELMREHRLVAGGCACGYACVKVKDHEAHVMVTRAEMKEMEDEQSREV